MKGKPATMRSDFLQTIRNFVCIALTFFFAHANAQDPEFKQYGIDEGLSQNTVSCIFQDSKGFMWFGTRDGLNKYDGYKFTVYKKSLQNKNSIGANDIKAIVEDARGKLWIATWAGGINIFNPKNESFQHIVNNPKDVNSIASNYIRSLLFDSDGMLWIGTGENGLDCYDTAKNNFTHFVSGKNNPETISDNTITALFEDDQKNIWAGTLNGGLNLFSKKDKTFIRLDRKTSDINSIPHNNVQFIKQASHKKLWIGTYGGGLSLLDTDNLKFKRISNSVKTQNIASVLLAMTDDPEGNLWIGTENNGLEVYHPSNNTMTTYYHYDNDNTSIGSNTIMSLYRDKKGNIWIGTFQGGINMLSRDVLKFKHYKHSQNTNSISSNTVTALFEDSHGNLWIGSDGGGLDVLDRKTEQIKHFSQSKNGLSSNHVLTINEDTEKKIWIGTWGEGISVYDPSTKKFKSYKTDINNETSVSSNYAFSIFRDSKQRMWITTYGNGLDLYNYKTDNFTRFTHDEKNPFSISTNYILTLLEDSKGRLWVGTDGGGLNYFNETENKFIAFKNTDSSKSISNNIINSICEDSDGFLWLGTNAGLDKFDPENKKLIASFYTEQGLPNDVIAGILEDNKRNLWIGTAKGLSKFTPSTKTFKNFTLSDGIQGNEFRTQCKGKNGLMYFAGKNGINEFNPDQIKSQAFDPPIVLTGFQIFNKDIALSTPKHTTPLKASINESKTLQLSYKESVITFEFASLNYTGAEKKQYRYKLDGFDKDWNYIGSKNNVTYTNLNPGQYTFKVSGLTNEGQWSNTTAEIILMIAPPFWQTWWFKLIFALAVIVIVGLIFYIRIETIKKRNRFLKDEVKRRTTELVEANSSLMESNEEIKIQNEKLEELNQEITRKSDKILEQQEKIISQNHTLEETVDKLAKTNHTKDRFFSILAHDLKNPIAALTGITDVLKAKIDSLNKEDLHKYVDNINQSSHAVNKLLIDLLDWAKTHSHDIPFTPVTVNVYELIRKNVALVEQQVNKKFIQVKADINTTHCIHGDYNMIDTVIRNILNNSVKFTPNYGMITVMSTASENEISIIISDSGTGMTEEKIQNLFKIDKKDISTGTNGETGTGLGLIITKEFIEINKGNLAIESKPGEGSHFTISLPRATLSMAASPQDQRDFAPVQATESFSIEKLPEGKLAKIKGKRILIVDDNKEIRSLLRLLLSGTCEIFEAENGEEGIRAAYEHQPVVIISDMIMPVMDGLAFCKEIKNNPGTSHIPVILLTSQREDEHQLSGYEAGADVYLMKPVKHNILFQVIHNVLTNQERLHQKYASSNEIYPEDLPLNKLDEEFLTKVVSYIEQHLSESNLDHKKLCDLTAMSRSLLYLKIKTLTGHGVHDLIKSIRLKKGLQLLVEGKLNITQVAFEVGFATPSHFSKSFIKQYDVSPSEYISNLKKKTSPASKPL